MAPSANVAGAKRKGPGGPFRISIFRRRSLGRFGGHFRFRSSDRDRLGLATAFVEDHLVAASRDARSRSPPVATEIGPVASALGAYLLAVLPGGRSAPGAVRIRFSAAPEVDPIAAFRRRHGLTERETQVASLLARGCTLPDIAELLGIGLTTARTHLGRLFDKTGTRTQLSLALYIARAVEWPGAGLRGQSGD